MPNPNPTLTPAPPAAVQDHKLYMPLLQRSDAGATPTPTPTATPTGGGNKRVVIDPITRIEGHLRMEVQVDNGAVSQAWSSSTMFRGIEMILKGRDPRDAWFFLQRLCGVCTTVHAIASVRTVENALGIVIPDNARILRNLIEAAQFLQDHVVHFYHLHGADWVDIPNALSADPAATGALARSVSDWPNSSTAYFTGVRDRLQTFVNSGQLGLFANGYWGHPAYKLPPEANLLATAHYLEALDWQRSVMKILAYLGGKSTHPQTYLVGGMAIPLDPSNPNALTPARLDQIKVLAQGAYDFVSKVYLPDLLLIASYYKDWAAYGGGAKNFLTFGDFPTAVSDDPAVLWLPRGVVLGGRLDVPPQPVDQAQIQEFVTHSWYAYSGGDQAGKHPYLGETTPNFTGPQPPFDYLNVDGKYSWLKAPRYSGLPMEVGPLARVVVAYASGHTRARQLVDQVLAKLGVGPAALFSTLGRTAARGIETLMIAEQILGWFDELKANIQGGNLTIHNGARWDPATWPADATGWGTTEAARGALGHWIHIQNGKILNYQAVVPTTWNGSPRDAQGVPGAWETALVGTPVADSARPLEVIRTIHSFDPCMSCAVHLVDKEEHALTHIEAH